LEDSNPNARNNAAVALIRIGRPGTEPRLINALNRVGDKKMAEVFLNSDNSQLKEAAENWARKKGYSVVDSFPRIGPSPTWGSQ